MAEYTVDGRSMGILPHRIAWSDGRCSTLEFSTFFASGILIAAPEGSPILIEGCGSAVPVIADEYSGVFFADRPCQLSARVVDVARGTPVVLAPTPGQRIEHDLSVPEQAGNSGVVFTEKTDHTVLITESSVDDLFAGDEVLTINHLPAASFGPIALSGLGTGPVGETVVVGLARTEIVLTYTR